AAQVCAAINGFCAHGGEGAIPRPDVLIVARGGGSVEDLWPFNDEQLARTVAACTIPLISAVGHETDTTLIDFVSDRRAPTPTAAAEMVTPVLAELRAAVSDLSARMHRCGGRVVEDRRSRILAADRTLRRVGDTWEMAAQRFNLASGRLAAALQKNQDAHERQLVRVTSRLSPHLLERPQRVQADRLEVVARRLSPAAARRVAQESERFSAVAARLQSQHLERPQRVQADQVRALGSRLDGAYTRLIDRASERLASLEKLRVSLNPDRPLRLGFARVHRPDGSLVTTGAQLSAGDAVSLVFQDKENVRHAVVDGAAPELKPARAARPKAPAAPATQGDLF
ncbi:exodeoxyribonuclease VII large subunit, partial [Phenylobacterium sp.]|uniref:exodeoxyribonuclease VII large subunit n=1 Tax=Phenylobacterium sp. TaxID=1871053 RepID=UPI002E375DE5